MTRKITTNTTKNIFYSKIGRDSFQCRSANSLFMRTLPRKGTSKRFIKPPLPPVALILKRSFSLDSSSSSSPQNSPAALPCGCGGWRGREGCWRRGVCGGAHPPVPEVPEAPVRTLPLWEDSPVLTQNAFFTRGKIERTRLWTS